MIAPSLSESSLSVCADELIVSRIRSVQSSEPRPLPALYSPPSLRVSEIPIRPTCF